MRAKLVTGGTYDLLHYGHVLHLDACVELIGKPEDVVVMLVSDEWGRRRKREPIISYLERKQMLIALGFHNIRAVDAPEDLLKVVQDVMPAYYEYDYGTNSAAHDPVIAFCREHDIKLVGLAKEPINPFGTSTSSIIEKIRGVP